MCFGLILVFNVSRLLNVTNKLINCCFVTLRRSKTEIVNDRESLRNSCFVLGRFGKLAAFERPRFSGACYGTSEKRGRTQAFVGFGFGFAAAHHKRVVYGSNKRGTQTAGATPRRSPPAFSGHQNVVERQNSVFGDTSKKFAS